MGLPVVLYWANIIDYFRVVMLWLAITDNPAISVYFADYELSKEVQFTVFYALSYILDMFDGPVARFFHQESKLGYYLDMVIDRISSCLLLHYMATSLDENESNLGLGSINGIEINNSVFAMLAYVCLYGVEIIAHAVVCYLAEVQEVHQKKLGYQYTIVKLYLNYKPILGWACISYEAFSLAVILGFRNIAIAFLPGFLFRAAANLMRLFACITYFFTSARKEA